jgi:hemoglobin
MKRTIYEKYGGFAHINRVVTDLYDKVLDSPILSPYFADVDMRRLIDHQTRFIATVMGGPASYSDDHLERVHRTRGITEESFAETVLLLQETLEEHSFEDEDIHLVLDRMRAYRYTIVSERSEQSNLRQVGKKGVAYAARARETS